jgi:aspartate/methionine/tyrosine aminotransferase
MQEACASGLEQSGDRQFFKTQLAEYEERRDILASAFEKLGLKYTMPQGSYFILLDISPLKIPEDYPFPQSVLGRGKDFKACWFIAMEVGVSSIPVSEVSQRLSVLGKSSCLSFSSTVRSMPTSERYMRVLLSARISTLWSKLGRDCSSYRSSYSLSHCGNSLYSRLS